MPYPLSLSLTPKQTQKQLQRLMMTPQMQQAIHFLQLPLMELSEVIQEEMEQNPVLEYEEEETSSSGEEVAEENPEKEVEFDEHQFDILKQLDDEFRDYLSDAGPFIPRKSAEDEKRRAFLENSIQEEPALSDHLMKQAREAFSDPQDLAIAEVLIGYLDQQGLITTPISEISACFPFKEAEISKVLQIIQSFDPIGVGSQNVQEVLKAQLRAQGKENSLSYKIIDRYFEDLLHNRLPKIQKGLKVSLKELKEVIQEEISHLELHPATPFAHAEAPTLIPDVRIKSSEEGFIAEVNDERILPLRLNRKYLKMLDDESVPVETKNFIKSKILSAKWLMRNVSQRNDTLIKIANFLGNYQKKFFGSSEGKLVPLVFKQVAEALNLHESTIARAVAHKYLDTPRGILPFRYFFSNAYVDQKGEDVSSETIRDLIEQFIKKEDKKKPLSDEAISKKLVLLGLQCARRTVAKYRGELEIGNTQERREYT